MTNLDTLISIVQSYADKENQAGCGCREKIKVEKEKKFATVINDHLSVGWHYEMPNDLCVFINTLDNVHCAAYEYVCIEGDTLTRKLIVSDENGTEDPRDLSPLDASLSDDEIARQLIGSVVDATNRSRRN